MLLFRDAPRALLIVLRSLHKKPALARVLAGEIVRSFDNVAAYELDTDSCRIS